MFLRILALLVPLAVLALPDSPANNAESENERQTGRSRNRRRRGNRGPGKHRNPSDAGKLKTGELPNDDVRQTSSGGPGDPVRRERDSAVEGDLQPVIVAAPEKVVAPVPPQSDDKA